MAGYGIWDMGYGARMRMAIVFCRHSTQTVFCMRMAGCGLRVFVAREQIRKTTARCDESESEKARESERASKQQQAERAADESGRRTKSRALASYVGNFGQEKRA